MGLWHVNSLGPQAAQVQDEKDIISRKRLRDLINNQSKYMPCLKPLTYFISFNPHNDPMVWVLTSPLFYREGI